MLILCHMTYLYRVGVKVAPNCTTALTVRYAKVPLTCKTALTLRYVKVSLT